MNNIKGPAIFLAQFVGEDAPFNSLDNICKWVSSLGYKGVQIPSWDARLIDLKKASESKDYCDEIKGVTKKYNLEITELFTLNETASLPFNLYFNKFFIQSS
jgi:sugar phosphate isomerase/epimerase